MPDSAYLVGPARARRPNVLAREHVVVSGHYYASLAGLQILEAGGNAIDAGVATGLAIDVLESEFVGFGGVAPVMVHMAESDQRFVISGVGVWPKAASLEYFHAHFGGQIPEGLLQCVVPAAPSIWIEALARFGTMSFGDVAAAAIRFARDGFPTYPFLAEQLAARVKEFGHWPSTAAIFLPGGRPPRVGERFVQSDLGRTLQYMADEEKAARGDRLAGLRAARNAFYRGDIAQTILRHQAENGGWLTAEDFADFVSPIEQPCRIRFGAFDVFGCGPWSQGPMVLEALHILAGCELRAMGHNSTQYIHTVTEALKLAAADREVYFGDPSFVDVPLEALLSADYAARRRKMIDAAKAWPGMPPAGEVGGVSIPPWRPDASSGAALDVAATKPETSFLCVADKHGNVFAATPSDPTISGPVVPGTGITVSMWGSRGYTSPDHPARVGPGRRPRMSANPAIAVSADAVVPFGSPGSEVLGQAMVQVFLNQAVFGMDAQSACEAPRFASYSWPESQGPHSYRPGHLCIEEDVGRATGDALAAMGHRVEWWPERKYLAGSVCTIWSDLKSGVKWAGADPRRTAYAVGW